MMGMGLAIILYLITLYYDVWNIIPQEHKFWLGLAILLVATSDGAERVIYREKS